MRIHQVFELWLGQNVMKCDPPELKMHTKSPTEICIGCIGSEFFAGKIWNITVFVIASCVNANACINLKILF